MTSAHVSRRPTAQTAFRNACCGRRRAPCPDRIESRNSVLRKVPRNERPSVQSYPPDTSRSERNERKAIAFHLGALPRNAGGRLAAPDQKHPRNEAPRADRSDFWRGVIPGKTSRCQMSPRRDCATRWELLRTRRKSRVPPRGEGQSLWERLRARGPALGSMPLTYDATPDHARLVSACSTLPST